MDSSAYRTIKDIALQNPSKPAPNIIIRSVLNPYELFNEKYLTKDALNKYIKNLFSKTN